MANNEFLNTSEYAIKSVQGANDDLKGRLKSYAMLSRKCPAFSDASPTWRRSMCRSLNDVVADRFHLQSSKKCEQSTGKVNLKFWQEGGPMKCVTQSLKKVLFYEFQGLKSEVAFLKFIAERGRVLEKMVVVVASECFSPVGNVGAKLKPPVSAKWSSKACKLELVKSRYEEVRCPVYCHELASDFGFADPFDLKYYDETKRIFLLLLA
uniref:FBD domain-containing protein n=1 Tax=Aegilops tauschii TaxID=37682 RepID=R7WD58_AEGTA